jgi:hypothetical protein
MVCTRMGWPVSTTYSIVRTLTGAPFFTSLLGLTFPNLAGLCCCWCRCRPRRRRLGQLGLERRQG